MFELKELPISEIVLSSSKRRHLKTGAMKVVLLIKTIKNCRYVDNFSEYLLCLNKKK